MLINSKNNDYYDGLSKQYLDKSIVYNREEVTLPTNTLDNRSSLYSLLRYFYSLHRQANSRDLPLNPILLGFCGEFYILYKFDWDVYSTEDEIINLFSENILITHLI